jgi:hypothetical protein
MQSISSSGLSREERSRARTPKLPGAYRTRHESAEYLQSRGYPLSYSTLTKLCALGEGPEPAAWWGSRPLYTEQGLDAWAEARSRRHRKTQPVEGTADDQGGLSAPLPMATPLTPLPKRRRPAKARPAGEAASHSAATGAR